MSLTIGTYLLAAAAYVGVLFLPWPALAQQPPLTVAEQRLGLCTVEMARMQQQLIEAQQKIAAMEKAAKPAVPAEVK